MATFSITVPDDVDILINLIVDYTGRTRSGVCSDLIKDGAYREIEFLKSVEGFKALLRKNQASRDSDSE